MNARSIQVQYLPTNFNFVILAAGRPIASSRLNRIARRTDAWHHWATGAGRIAHVTQEWSSCASRRTADYVKVHCDKRTDLLSERSLHDCMAGGGSDHLQRCGVLDRHWCHCRKRSKQQIKTPVDLSRTGSEQEIEVGALSSGSRPHTGCPKGQLCGPLQKLMVIGW
jgi:hypothetical protein